MSSPRNSAASRSDGETRLGQIVESGLGGLGSTGQRHARVSAPRLRAPQERVAVRRQEWSSLFRGRPAVRAPLSHFAWEPLGGQLTGVGQPLVLSDALSVSGHLLGQIWPNFGRIWAMLPEPGMISAKFGPTFGPIAANFGPDSSTFLV